MNTKLKISISFATIRNGWLENTFKCLGNQTLPKDEWELIMIDDAPDKRSEYALSLAKKEGINTKWMRSKPNNWKSNRLLGNARNTGLIHSDGELVVFLDDYTWIPPTFLQEHWDIYKLTSGGVIGRVKSVKYCEDITSELDLTILSDDQRYELLEKKQDMVFDAKYAWFYTFNASAPLEKIIGINGYDEEFDCTGEEDIDLGERLSRMGMEFTYNTNTRITAYHMQHGGQNARIQCTFCRTDLVYDENIWKNVILCPKCENSNNISLKMREINVHRRYPDKDVHIVTPDTYITMYGGSWGLLERNKRFDPGDVNENIFNLKTARENREKYQISI